MTNEKTRRLAVSGLFCAIIFVATAYFHVPTGLGYTHLGDGFIFLAAALLPTPYAIGAAAVGAGLADAASGMAVWLPATVVLKALTALCFSNKTAKPVCLRNLTALVPALLINVFGYSFYEAAVMTKGSLGAAFAAAIGQAPFYTIQTALGAVVFVALGKAIGQRCRGFIS